MGARDAGVVSSAVKAEDVESAIQDALVDVEKQRADLVKVASTLPKDSRLKTLGVEGGTTQARKFMSEADKASEATKTAADITRGDVDTGMLSQEMFNQQVTRQMFDFIAGKAAADPSNIAWKLLDFTFNKMSSGYQTIDQSFKMATILRATVDGYTKNQLNQLKNIVNINPEEL